MGRFSINVNVKFANFSAAFTEIMKKHGYEPCTKDYATLSYLTAQSGGWATLRERITIPTPKRHTPTRNLLQRN